MTSEFIGPSLVREWELLMRPAVVLPAPLLRVHLEDEVHVHMSRDEHGLTIDDYDRAIRALLAAGTQVDQYPDIPDFPHDELRYSRAVWYLPTSTDERTQRVVVYSPRYPAPRGPVTVDEDTAVNS